MSAGAPPLQRLIVLPCGCGPPCCAWSLVAVMETRISMACLTLPSVHHCAAGFRLLNDKADRRAAHLCHALTVRLVLDGEVQAQILHIALISATSHVADSGRGLSSEYRVTPGRGEQHTAAIPVCVAATLLEQRQRRCRRRAPFDGDEVAVHVLVDRAQVVERRPPSLHGACGFVEGGWRSTHMPSSMRGAGRAKSAMTGQLVHAPPAGAGRRSAPGARPAGCPRTAPCPAAGPASAAAAARRRERARRGAGTPARRPSPSSGRARRTSGSRRGVSGESIARYGVAAGVCLLHRQHTSKPVTADGSLTIPRLGSSPVCSVFI